MFLISGTAAALGGIYATVIFALCSLYGKTALGLNKDQMYEYFMSETVPQRRRAFKAFTASLLIFCIQVVLLFGMKSPAILRWPIVVAICVVIYYGREDCNSMIAAATPIFTGVLPKNNAAQKLQSENFARKRQ